MKNKPSQRTGPLSRIEDAFGAIAGRTATLAGNVWAFSSAVFIVLVWGLTGPAFDFSETWQLVINTGTTIVTFLMVFLIQHAQNKDMRVLHLKLNELIKATDAASNRLIDIEDLADHEVEALAVRYQRIAKKASLLIDELDEELNDVDDEAAS